GSTFVLLKPKAELHPVFLTAILTHDEQRIMAVREGSGIPHVPKDFLRWYRFLLPPLKEQEAIIRTIHGMAQLEDSINAQLDHLTTQKRGLMQQLLTGAVRVKA
ncbi:MAG TPA: restriction endonuclease subunit S, partial [Flavobacteriales bacterium]|nr:restriction endonuclease subunit S [Flavobacteriales bacterium]